MLEIDELLPQKMARSVGADRFGLQWHSCRLEAMCEWIDGSADCSRPATIRAFCTHGMALVVSDRSKPGTLLTVRMTTVTDRIAFAKLARIVHEQPEKLGDRLIGVVFLQPLAPEEVTWLLCPEAQQSSAMYFEIQRQFISVARTRHYRPLRHYVTVVHGAVGAENAILAVRG